MPPQVTGARFDDSADLHNISGGRADSQTGGNLPGEYLKFANAINEQSERLLTLPGDTVVRTGHGDDTTVGAEAPGIEAAAR